MKLFISMTEISLLLLGSLYIPAFSQIRFIEHTIDYNTRGTGGIHTCDIDGDGDIDVLGAGLEDNRIFYWRNSGTDPTSWTRYTIGSNVGSAHSVYAADIDLDGTLDVIGAAYTGTPGIAWWRNDGGNPIDWRKYTVAYDFINAHEIYAHDLDRDGDIDILGASSDLNTISWWRNDRGDPLIWTEQTISDDVTLAKSVHVGDFDNDGDWDIVGAAITAHDVIWWRNDGGDPIQWTEFLIDSYFLGAHRVQAIDLDKDGDDDILGAGYLGNQVAWWRNDGGDPVEWTRQNIGTGLVNACVASAGDIDGDNDYDVVVTAQGINEISWFENRGGDPIEWRKFVITDDFVRPWPLSLYDIDNDGDIDLVSGSSHQGSERVSWWENQGPYSIGEETGKPRFHVSISNYPNPFRYHTMFSLSSDLEGSLNSRSISVFDVSGRYVITVYPDESLSEELRITWDGRDNRGNPVGPGVYYYKLNDTHQRIGGRMVLVP